MKESTRKHTPGPWKTGPTSNYCVSGSNHQVARASGSGSDWIDLANARLIAVSPEMLESLVAAETALAIASSYVHREQKLMHHTLDIVRAVIARAKEEK